MCVVYRQGPSDPSKRKTTDCLCVILIAAMWFSLTVIGFIVCGVIESDDLPPGNPAKLTHMLDYDGGICAVTDGVEDKPYAYFLPSGQARVRPLQPTLPPPPPWAHSAAAEGLGLGAACSVNSRTLCSRR
jgi:hypothetical protein